MIYIAIKNNKIVHICDTTSEDNVIKSMAYEGITDYDKIEVVSNDYFQGKVGNDIREFNSTFEFLALSERADYVTIPEGQKIEGDEFVDMTVKEKIDARLTVLEDTQKYDEETESITDKDMYELYEDGLKTIDELKTYQKSLITGSFESSISDGYFSSEALGIEVDYRRGGTKNDLQNVEALINYMSLNDIAETTYSGYEDQTATATLAQVEALKIEMQSYGIYLYNKKNTLKAQIDAVVEVTDLSVTAEEIKAITW